MAKSFSNNASFEKLANPGIRKQTTAYPNASASLALNNQPTFGLKSQNTRNSLKSAT